MFIDMQRFMDGMSLAGRLSRQNYHLTLGKLIDVLKTINPEVVVKFSDGSYPTNEHSYRGYYSDLCFESQSEPTTAGEMLEMCERALDNTYVGYKGGDFLMDKDTPLWKADYGDTGDAVIDGIATDGELVLVTKRID